MQPSGNLSDISLPGLFHKICTNKVTGVLRMTQGKMIKEVYFESGQAVYIKSNILSETLGRVLLDNGLLSQENYEKSLRLMQTTHKPHGTILRELKALSISLDEALLVQMRHKLITCFRWREGTYSLRPIKNLPPDIEKFAVSIPFVILQGIKTSSSLDDLTGDLSVYMDVSLAEGRPVYSLGELGLTPDEEDIFHLIDGKRTVKDILEVSRLGLQDTLSLLYALLVLELVHPSSIAQAPDRAPAAPSPPSPAEEAPHTPRMSADHLALKQKMEERLSGMREQNHFQILNIPPGASKDQVKTAYYQLAKVYHPDRYYDAPESIKGLTDEIFTLITQAHSTLVNDEERKKYEEFLRTGKTEDDLAREATNILNAELAHQKGLALLKKGDVKGAEAQFSTAIELHPEEAEYHIYHGWTLFRLVPADSADFHGAKEAINKGLSMNGKVAQGHYFLGMIYKREGRETEAREAFQRAIRCDPNHVDALREVRLMTMRGKKEDKGIFGKIFK